MHASHQPTDRPNILLVLTDQHRLSAVGAYGPTPCQTPHIDSLAAQGVRFENAYTSCPVCTPARASILTGLAPHNHGMTNNVEDSGGPVSQMPDHPALLSRRLEQAGYQLGYTGKWHLGSYDRKKLHAPIEPSLPRDVGFIGDNFPGHGDGGWDYEQFKSYLRHRGLRCQYDQWPEQGAAFREARAFRRMTCGVEATVPYYLADNTIDLIDQFTTNDSDQPFFIWHNFWGPHEPYCPTEQYLDMYRDVSIEPWPNFDWPALAMPGPHRFALSPVVVERGENLPWSDWEMGIRYYYAFTTMIDAQIGRIVDRLRSGGLFDNTIIIFMADHGEALGDHGGTYNKGWTHFEETHRIPMIVRMPDGTGAASGAAAATTSGVVRDQIVSLLDIYPTILDMAGAPVPAERPGQAHNWPYDTVHHPDGQSLMPLIRDENVPWGDIAVSSFHGLLDNNAVMRTMRCGKYKFGYTFLGPDMLFDLEQDPYELHNLADDPNHADTVTMMLQRLHDWMTEHTDSAAYGLRMTRLIGKK